MAMRRKVHTRTPIADDLEVHTATVRVGDQTFFEVRQFIPSLRQYGRGVALPHTDKVFTDLNVAVARAQSEKTSR